MCSNLAITRQRPASGVAPAPGKDPTAKVPALPWRQAAAVSRRCCPAPVGQGIATRKRQHGRPSRAAAQLSAQLLRRSGARTFCCTAHAAARVRMPPPCRAQIASLVDAVILLRRMLRVLPALAESLAWVESGLLQAVSRLGRAVRPCEPAAAVRAQRRHSRVPTGLWQTRIRTTDCLLVKCLIEAPLLPFANANQVLPPTLSHFRCEPILCSPSYRGCCRRLRRPWRRRRRWGRQGDCGCWLGCRVQRGTMLAAALGRRARGLFSCLKLMHAPRRAPSLAGPEGFCVHLSL
jgi:hypothetical protein